MKMLLPFLINIKQTTEIYLNVFNEFFSWPLLQCKWIIILKSLAPFMAQWKFKCINFILSSVDLQHSLLWCAYEEGIRFGSSKEHLKQLTWLPTRVIFIKNVELDVEDAKDVQDSSEFEEDMFEMWNISQYFC